MPSLPRHHPPTPPPSPTGSSFPPPPPQPPSPSPPRPRPPGTEAPPTRAVPPFDPVRVRGGRYRLHRLLGHRGPAVAAGLAVTAVALVAAGPRSEGAGAEPRGAERAHGRPVAGPARPRPPAELVTAPVRIADAATVRLLHPGDRVDVIAAEDASAGAGVRVLARGARVTEVPEPPAAAAGSGALVVLSVPRPTAARLVGASATARLAVTLC